MAALALTCLPASAQDAELEAACKARVGGPGRAHRRLRRTIDSGGYAGEPWVSFRRGDAHGDADDHEAAVADHTRALEVDPDYQRALGGCAYSLFQLRRYEELPADTAQLIRVDPDDAWNHNLHGRAIELDDDSYWPRPRRGALFLRLDRSDKAVRDLEDAKAVLPFATAAYEYLGNHY